jgi:hypothetical protein
MALRTFTDSRGGEWQVWNILPMFATGNESDCSEPGEVENGSRRPGEFHTPGLATGWLCFDNGVEKRRLSPIPDGWEDAPDITLEALCRQATAVRRMSAGLT